jgi:hypothetical protein
MKYTDYLSLIGHLSVLFRWSVSSPTTQQLALGQLVKAAAATVVFSFRTEGSIISILTFLCEKSIY